MALKYLFVDMNAYFASVEQQFRPELRGRPVAVVPVMAETTCCIAASYEARPFGVKTGTIVAEARRMCPNLRFIEARHELYVRVHEAICAAVESCLPIRKVHSIDEMSCTLSSTDATIDRATDKARAVKAALRRHVGEFLTCSIGLSSSPFLAKVAADMKKPDGLTVLPREELPQALYGLELIDFPGIGPRRNERLMTRHGIRTVRQLCDLSPEQMERVWGGPAGRAYWLALRGHDLVAPPTQRGTVSHSHVLPPKWRTAEAAQGVLIRMLCKAAARMRLLKYEAGRLDVFVTFLGGGHAWHDWARLGSCCDTSSMMEAFVSMWARRPGFDTPMKVGVVLSDLTASRSATAPLFQGERNRVDLSRAMDEINERYGRDAVHLGSVHTVLESAPTRIAFSNVPDLDDPSNWSDAETSTARAMVRDEDMARPKELKYEQDEFSQEIGEFDMLLSA